MVTKSFELVLGKLDANDQEAIKTLVELSPKDRKALDNLKDWAKKLASRNRRIECLSADELEVSLLGTIELESDQLEKRTDGDADVEIYQRRKLAWDYAQAGEYKKARRELRKLRSNAKIPGLNWQLLAVNRYAFIRWLFSSYRYEK